MYRSPEETQKDVSELIRRYYNEKKAQEELTKEYEKNFSQSQGPTWYQVSQKKSEVVKQPSTRIVSFTEPEIDLATSSDATIQSNTGKVLPKMGNVQSGHQNEQEKERRRIIDDTIAELSEESSDEDAQPTIGETSISALELQLYVQKYKKL